MSVAPTRIYRRSLRTLWPYVITALRKDYPLPDRLLAIEILEVNLDQVLSSKMNPRIVAIFQKNIEDIISYMRFKGYEVSNPFESGKNVEEELSEFLRSSAATQRTILEWFRKEVRRRDDESLTRYVDRVAHFLARIVAVFTLVTAAEAE